MEQTLEAYRRVLPEGHPDTLMSMTSLAKLYLKLNRPAESLKLLEQTLAAQRRVLEKDDPNMLKSMWGVATTLMQLDRGAEAIPLIDECVAKAAGQIVPPGMIPSALVLRIQYFQKTGDPAGCRATAEMFEKLNQTNADNLYNAACFRAATAGVQAKTSGADAARLAQDDADRAMAWLHKVVKAGYKDVAHMQKDTDLDPLRDRDDFKKLIAELERKFPPMKEVIPPPKEGKK